MLSDMEVAPVAYSYSVPSCTVGDYVYCLKRQKRVRVDGFSGIMRWPTSGDCSIGKENRGRQMQSLVVTDELVRATAKERARVFGELFGCSKSVWYNIKSQFAQPEFPEITGEMRPLLFGPYSVPNLKRGDLATCLRLGPVKITSVRGPLQWPRCLPYPNVGSFFHRKASLLVTEDLIRALKNESNLGFAAWFGIHVKTCTRLRKDFGISGSTPGFRALHRVARNARIAKLNLKWTDQAISLLGTAPDHVIAHNLGIRLSGVVNKRYELRIPAFKPPPKPKKARVVNGEVVFVGRSPEWPDFRERFLSGKTCAACGGVDYLTVHHIRPFHMAPELEFEESNLIVLCSGEGKNCHHRVGHNFDWYSFNPYVVEDAALSLSRIRNKPNAIRLAETA